MNKGFVFDAGDAYNGEDIHRPPQSPWEFSGYAKASEQEHRERNTTSIDHKIRQRLNAGKRSRNVEESDEDEEDEDDELLEESWRLKKSGIKNAPVDSESEEDEESESEGDDAKTQSSEEEEELDEGEENIPNHNQNGTSHKKKPKAVTASDQEGGEELSEDEKNRPNASKYSAAKAGVPSDDEEEKETGAPSDDQEEEETEDEEDDKSYRKQPKKPAGANGQGTEFFSSLENVSFTASSFLELNVSRPLVRACEALGYRQPTPIQAACIPLALSGRDICGSAVTGSGKTAAFALPILERLLFRPRRIPAIRVLIVTPTRELAVQVHSMVEKLGQFTDIRCCLIVGGLSSKMQEVALRTHPDIVVATPGRMIDHLRNTQSVGLEDLAILVLDEADRLLELGFREEIHELVKVCPPRRQTMLFSATMTEEVSELVKLSLKSPVRLSADPSTQRPSTLSEEVIRIRPGHEDDKEAIVLSLCSRSFTQKTIIFSGMKVEAHRLKILFGLSGLKAAELHGNLTQAQRLEALDAFRKQEVDFLIATDVAARGLDIIGVESVINFECPKDIKTYVHRVGRTARAGRSGRAVTLMTERDRSLLKAVAKRAGSKLQKRLVPAGSVESCNKRIKNLEDDVHQILVQEREEKMMRKAEMEANKAQNMMDHESEIFSRPKKTWFRSEHEKGRVAKEAKGSVSKTKAISVNEAEEMKRKEKRKAEREKELPRKKRRRLEAAREAAEEEEGASLVDVAYKRAKAAKAVEKAKKEGRYVNTKAPGKKKLHNRKRKEEMKDAFEGDFSHSKRMKFTEKKTKKKPKIKARYKRRK